MLAEDVILALLLVDPDMVVVVISVESVAVDEPAVELTLPVIEAVEGFRSAVPVAPWMPKLGEKLMLLASVSSMISIVYTCALRSLPEGIVRVAVPSEAGTPAEIARVSCWMKSAGIDEVLTGQDETTVRGNGVLLQFDGDGAAGGIGPLNGEVGSSCHIQGALTCRNGNGIVLSGHHSGAESGDGREEETHLADQGKCGYTMWREMRGK